MDIYESARKHGVSDDDILHAIDFELVAAEQDDGKVLYLGPDKSGICSMSSPFGATPPPRS